MVGCGKYSIAVDKNRLCHNSLDFKYSSSLALAKQKTNSLSRANKCIDFAVDFMVQVKVRILGADKRAGVPIY